MSSNSSKAACAAMRSRPRRPTRQRPPTCSKWSDGDDVAFALFRRMINVVLPQTAYNNPLPLGLSGDCRETASRIGRGFLPVNEIIAKIARIAVSKGSAFSYAVAVGVAGNVIFHYVQPPEPVPVVATLPHAAAPAGGLATAGSAPSAMIAPVIAPVIAPGAPARASVPATPSAPQPEATAAALPEPPSAITLPGPTALPVPALQPTAVPPSPASPPPAAESGTGVAAILPSPAATQSDAATPAPA